MRTLALPTIVLTFAVFLAVPRPAGAAATVLDFGVDGSIAVKDGETSVATFKPKTPIAQRGVVVLHESKVSGHAVLEVRIPVLGEGPKREELWIAERTRTGAKTIWWDLAGATDPDGETGLVIKVMEHGIEEYQTARRLSRCDGAEVALFRRTWDFATHKFRPAPPELPPRGSTLVKAQRGNAPTGKPLGGFFFTAASSSKGVDGKASRLRPPAAVNDDNPETSWSTEDGGRGHLLTARSSGGFAVTGLRILPGDTTNAPRFRASAKPKRLTLLLGRDPADTVEVTLVEDRDGGVKRFRDPFWIELPKPVATSCVTVLIRDATSEKSPLFISDLDVMTELDGPDAADRLVASLAEGKSCAARQPLLIRLGEKALPKLEHALAGAAPGGGRACLLDGLAALLAGGTPPTPETAKALVAALPGASKDEEKTILKWLPSTPAIPIDELADMLSDDKRSDEDRERAARALAAIEQAPAREKLFAAVGHGSQPLRKRLRLLLAVSKAPALHDALAQYDATPADQTDRRADLLAIVGSLAAKETGERSEALATLRTALESQAPFEVRGRAIQALGLIGGPVAIEALVSVRNTSTDGVLRSLAISELANASGPAVIAALRAALEDADPMVRKIAAGALGRKGDDQSAKLLITGAEQEPWPEVRRAEIVALGKLCTPEGNELLLRAFKKDVEEVRQAALTGIAHCYQGKAAGTLLHALGRLAESADMRSLAARLLAARKDPRTVPGMAEALTRLLTESQADLSLEGVIADTAMALAIIRTPPAITALAALVSDPRPSVQSIGIEALSTVCDPGAGAAALRVAAKSKDASVSARANAAEARCREPR